LSCVLCSQSTREKIIKNLNNAVAIVGTPDAILNFLPFINTDFTWIIMDEIHMIGKIEGSSMEVIAKVFNSTNFLALSATIGNLTEVTSWFQKLNPKRSVQNIVCDKRFFNLQKYYYNSKENQLNILHPLALVNVDDFATKNLSATPTDTWLLYSKLKEEFSDLGNLNHDKYFGIREIIHLDRVNKYFMELIQYMSTKDKVVISKIIDSFKKVDLSDEPVDLVKLAFTLKESNKVPAIVFQKNTLACIKMIMEFGNKIEDLENAEFPDLYNVRVSDREKGEKISISIAKLEKKILSEQKQSKKNRDKGKMMGRNINNKNVENDDEQDEEEVEEEETNEAEEEDPIQVLHNKLNLLDLANPYEPHYKYIFNPIQIFNEEKITDIINELKIWFPNEKGGRPHIIIRLLWRGIGIYAKGLPDPYLRLIQKLTCEKNIAILFSDMSLVLVYQCLLELL
jgi:superfamily II RNA helicase